MKVIHGFWTCVDLNTTQQGQSLLGATGTRLDNVLHQHVLRIIERVGQFQHAILGIRQALAMRKNEFLHGALLKVTKFLNLGSNRGTAVGNALQVVGSGNGTATAVIDEFNTCAFDFANGSIRRNTNVRTIDNETKAIIWNMGRPVERAISERVRYKQRLKGLHDKDANLHCTKACVAGKGKA